MKKTILSTILIFCLISCVRTDTLFIVDDNRFNNLKNLNLKEAINFELQSHSAEIKSINVFHKENLTFENPKAFVRNDNNLGLETDYFCDESDSLVKVIMYEWGNPYLNDKKIPRRSNEKINSDLFEKKYGELSEQISEKLGNVSISKNIDEKLTKQRLEIWQGNNVTVFLSLQHDEYTSIQLVVSKN